MPSLKTLPGGQSSLLDVRPDRKDFRDFLHRPPVENLPAVFPSSQAFQTLLPDGVLNRLPQVGNVRADTGVGLIESAHGCFDNRFYHIEKCIREIRGDGLLKPIGPLVF